MDDNRTLKWVVAFNRDRDFYQVPAALAEGDRLARLVTDLYVPDSPFLGRVFGALGLGHRRTELIPSRLVKCSARATLLQILNLWWAKTREEGTRIFNKLDSHLSDLAAKEAIRVGAGLFLYSGYAMEAFSKMQDRAIPKLLFVYHPQGDYVKSILEADFEEHSEIEDSYRQHLAEISVNEGERVAAEIERATGIACASSFTARSVNACLEGRRVPVSVVPYGCPSWTMPEQVHNEAKRGRRPQVLFVGQGTQRKGLHHLIKVWREGLHKMADLTLVLSSADASISKMVRSLPSNHRVLSGLSREELKREFQRADIFVLPSLVEGFGLVYLEALASGCFVIGTENTGLPDLNPSIDVATVIDPGNLPLLSVALETAIGRAVKGDLDRAAIKAFAASRTWEGFRKGIRKFVGEATSTGAVA